MKFLDNIIERVVDRKLLDIRLQISNLDKEITFKELIDSKNTIISLKKRLARLESDNVST
jgi:hypothetical protein